MALLQQLQQHTKRLEMAKSKPAPPAQPTPASPAATRRASQRFEAHERLCISLEDDQVHKRHRFYSGEAHR